MGTWARAEKRRSFRKMGEQDHPIQNYEVDLERQRDALNNLKLPVQDPTVSSSTDIKSAPPADTLKEMAQYRVRKKCKRLLKERRIKYPLH